MSRIHDALRKAEQDRAADLSPETIAGRTKSADPLFPPTLQPESELGFESREPIDSHLRALKPADGMTFEGSLAECPQSPWKPDPRMVLFGDPRAAQVGTEEFRTLRTQLTQMREKLPLQTVLVTSALAGEGKTFVAANLAQAFVQQHGRRVLLIDADLRLAKLHTLLGAARTPGLADFLSGEADASRVFQRGASENLFFIPAGRAVSNPIELIGNGRLKGLLHRLAPVFDWIVIDSPPCVPLSDASLLADLTDGVLMVVYSGKTPFDIAQKAAQMFRDRHLLGVVLNQVPPQAAYSAYYYRPAEDRVGKNGSRG
ncbi:MAG TPA: CpsD/CapB family tyrosine-protein kinase [Terriglobia bacterium]|nr:CpsD/CapB family tyrosine-protein kinase [Terriglobia bacterium]